MQNMCIMSKFLTSMQLKQFSRRSKPNIHKHSILKKRALKIFSGYIENNNKCLIKGQRLDNKTVRTNVVTDIEYYMTHLNML